MYGFKIYEFKQVVL